MYLLRHPHGKRGAVGGQNRTKGAFGGGLTRKHAVNVEFLRGNYTLAMKNRQKIRPKRPESDINLNFDESDAEIEGIGRCFAQIENIKRQSLIYLI